MTTFVVFTEYGEYSDYSTRVVAVHRDRITAERHVSLANEWEKGMYRGHDSEKYNKAELMNPYDPGASSQSWSAYEYSVLEVPLGWELPP